jgi:hypothetical protein
MRSAQGVARRTPVVIQHAAVGRRTSGGESWSSTAAFLPVFPDPPPNISQEQVSLSSLLLLKYFPDCEPTNLNAEDECRNVVSTSQPGGK